MNKVLFEITEDHLETGMRGYPVGYCPTSTVDPKNGLFYMGQPVLEMAEWEPERVIYLIFYGKVGSDSEIESFKNELQKRAQCSLKVIEHIRKLPKEGHPMKLYSSALLICGMLEGTGDYKEDALNLIAKVPVLVATLINYHAGWENLNPSKPELGYMENFTHMLNVPDADNKVLEKVFKIFNVLHYDHGGGNLSAFVGKAIASSLEDLYGSLSGAMCGLAGPRHGKANQDSLNFVNEVLKEVGEDATLTDVESLISKKLDNNELIYGFGHAVLRVEDPRASVFYKLAEEKFPDHPLVKIALKLREAGPAILGQNPKIADPFPNVDAISGTLLTAAGFPYPEYYTVLFGLSRVIGITRQIVYERTEARGGKGTPIIRPKYLFKPV